MAVLLSGKSRFQSKENYQGHKETLHNHKRAIHQEDILSLNVYALNNRTAK